MGRSHTPNNPIQELKAKALAVLLFEEFGPDVALEFVKLRAKLQSGFTEEVNAVGCTLLALAEQPNKQRHQP